MLLSRVADSVYWGARYLERAEDTSRIVRAWTELVIDLPIRAVAPWEPLLAIAGSRATYDAAHAATHEQADTRPDERSIIRFLLADPANPGSVSSCVAAARENLRTVREVVPREGWQVVNDLHLYVAAHRDAGVDRRTRGRFTTRVIDDARRLEGVIESTLTRDEAYEFWRLGQAVERADMITRVLGVAAASLLLAEAEGRADRHDEVQWMGVLRSVSAMQMYERATRGPIEGPSVVRFLLFHEQFPRSVASCLARVRTSISRLPRSAEPAAVLDEVVERLRSSRPSADDGAELDQAMDALQIGLAALNDQLMATYVHVADRLPA
jgi:uncharacterized alpha-E superfamily protein